MTIVILRKNIEYLEADIFFIIGGQKQHNGLWQLFQNLSVIRFSFTIRYLLTKDNNKEIIGCADLATNIFNSATSESAIIFRENKHTFIKQNTRHTDPVKWRIPCDMISSF